MTGVQTCALPIYKAHPINECLAQGIERQSVKGILIYIVVQQRSRQPVVSQGFAVGELVLSLTDLARYLDSRVYEQYACSYSVN